MASSVYQYVTDRVLALLDKGVIPWRKPWGSKGSKRMTVPMNLKSQKAYRGINVFLLWSAGYECPYWVSYKQCQEMGGQVNKGEKATLVVFWKVGTKQIEDKETGEIETKKTFLLRYYNVFNLQQTTLADRWEKPAAPEVNNNDIIAEAEKIIAGYKTSPEIEHGKVGAWYAPYKDLIGMPDMNLFSSGQEYYSTLFHEIVHSTGHATRLNRFAEQVNSYFGSEDYSKEELVAEFGATFLCGIAGIETKTIENSAAYIDNWRRQIKDDPKLLVNAAARAQRAADFIQGTDVQDEGDE